MPKKLARGGSHRRGSGGGSPQTLGLPGGDLGGTVRRRKGATAASNSPQSLAISGGDLGGIVYKRASNRKAKVDPSSSHSTANLEGTYGGSITLTVPMLPEDGDTANPEPPSFSLDPPVNPGTRPPSTTPQHTATGNGVPSTSIPSTQQKMAASASTPVVVHQRTPSGKDIVIDAVPTAESSGEYDEEEEDDDDVLYEEDDFSFRGRAALLQREQNAAGRPAPGAVRGGFHYLGADAVSGEHALSQTTTVFHAESTYSLWGGGSSGGAQWLNPSAGQTGHH